MDMINVYKEFIGKGLYQRINLILDHEIDIKSMQELYTDLPPFDYNISRPESISELDLKNFQMIILEASIKKLPYHRRKCDKCGNTFTLTFDQIQSGSNCIRTQCETCCVFKH